MGIIEFHLHEPDFDFSPSMRTGGDEDATDDTEDAIAVDTDDDAGGSGSGLGALVALGVLVVLGELLGLRRRRSGSDDEDTGETSLDEEIEISA